MYQLCEFAKEFAQGTVHMTGNHVDGSADTVQTCLDDNGLCDHMSYLLKGVAGSGLGEMPEGGSGRGGSGNGRDSSRKRAVLDEMLKHLRQITAKMKEREEQESLKIEWKIVAKILDRFFLMVFILLVIVSSVVLLYLYPMYSRTL